MMDDQGSKMIEVEVVMKKRKLRTSIRSNVVLASPRNHRSSSTGSHLVSHYLLQQQQQRRLLLRIVLLILVVVVVAAQGQQQVLNDDDIIWENVDYDDNEIIDFDIDTMVLDNNDKNNSNMDDLSSSHLDKDPTTTTATMDETIDNLLLVDEILDEVVPLIDIMEEGNDENNSNNNEENKMKETEQEEIDTITIPIPKADGKEEEDTSDTKTIEKSVLVNDDDIIIATTTTTTTTREEETKAKTPTLPDTVNTNNTNHHHNNVAENYLATLSNEELEKICMERGFEMDFSSSSFLSANNVLNHSNNNHTVEHHAMYVEAARKCLSLEDEINGILAKNPELAAELEIEIERMKQKKEQLELERDQLLHEKRILEQKLQQAGIVLPPSSEEDDDNKKKRRTSSSTTTTTTTPNNEIQSLEDVLKESFVLLFERVYQDVVMVQNLLQPILVPIGRIMNVMWISTIKPTCLVLARSIFITLYQLNQTDIIKALYGQVSIILFNPIRDIYIHTLVPLITTILEQIHDHKMIQMIRNHIQQHQSIMEPIHKKFQSVQKYVQEKMVMIRTKIQLWMNETIQGTSTATGTTLRQ